MKTATTRAFILSSKNIGEYDKMVFIYTDEFGKLKVIAKGARKITSKFTGHLESLNLCMASLYFSRNSIILREIITKNVGTNISMNLNKADSAMQMAAITNQMLFENQNIEELFELMTETSRCLRKSNRSLVILISYIIKLLDKIGIMPNHQTTDTRLDKRYRDFFEYVKQKSIEEISKISLKNEEKSYLKNYIEQILQNETQIKWQLLAS